MPRVPARRLQPRNRRGDRHAMCNTYQTCRADKLGEVVKDVELKDKSGA